MPRRGRRSTSQNRGRLRYTKLALLTFGLGVGLGFVIVVGEFGRYERVASAVMALGLVLIPLALFADGRGVELVAWVAARFRMTKPAKPRRKSRPPAARRNSPKPGARSPRAGRSR